MLGGSMGRPPCAPWFMRRKESLHESEDAGSSDAKRSAGKRAETAHESERRCPYCRERVQPEASLCPHCRAFIDPRFPPTLIDEGAYRRARMLILSETKDEIFKWAHSRVTWAAGIVGLLVSIGALTLVRLTANQLIERSLQTQLNERVGEIRASMAEFRSEISSNQAELATAKTTIEEKGRWTTKLYHQLEAESQARVDRLSSRISSAGSSLVLNFPDSLKGERPRVLYGSEEEEIRFQWSSFAEFGAAEPVLYKLEIRPLDVAAGQYVFVTNTVFNSSKISPDELFKRWNADPSKFYGHLSWKVVAVNKGASQRGLASAEGVFEYYPDAITRIRKTRKVRVGITVEKSPPFVEQTIDSSDLTGFDIELARRVVLLIPYVKRWQLKVSPAFQQFDWIPLLNALRSSEADFIISSITKRTEREKEYDLVFTDAYYTTFQALLLKRNLAAAVRARLEPPGSSAPLDGYSVVAQKGTTGLLAAHAMVSEPAAVKDKEDLNQVVNSILNGESDIAVIDEPIAKEQTKKSKALEVIVLGERAPIKDEYCIAVGARQKDLLDTINMCLKLLKNWGALEELKEKYGLVTGKEAPTANDRAFN